MENKPLAFDHPHVGGEGSAIGTRAVHDLRHRWFYGIGWIAMKTEGYRKPTRQTMKKSIDDIKTD